uniref:DDE-1 domain-containing protein n=1 Tax=Arion vulgaris TaxID=1028688 RepID=A0A0B7BUR4_9EUPU
MRAAICAVENNTITPSWSVLDAIKAIAVSWESVPSKHLQNCFSRAWRHSNTNPIEELDGDIDTTSHDEWDILQDVANPGVSFEEFISADDDVAVCSPEESDVHVQSVVCEVQEISSEESDEDNSIPPTRQEVLTALDTLERFATTAEMTARFTEAIHTVGREVTMHFRSRLRQRNIQEFFCRK